MTVSHSQKASTRKKAEYAKEAPQDTQLRPNQTVSIPIALREDMAIDALRELQGDISQRDESDLNVLEREIDEAVFEPYDMSEQSVQEQAGVQKGSHSSTIGLAISPPRS
jgi:hypothetical protein